MNNDTLDKLAETYASDDSDAKEYQKSLQSVIITQTRNINELRKKLEEMSGQLEKLTIENTRLKALGADPTAEIGNDAESICLVQLALINNFSMQRELTLEETKKSEIFTKMLILLRGKQEKKEVDTVGSLSNEDLMKALSAM